jgi:hypothetical protein
MGGHTTLKERQKYYVTQIGKWVIQPEMLWLNSRGPNVKAALHLACAMQKGIREGDKRDEVPVNLKSGAR